MNQNHETEKWHEICFLLAEASDSTISEKEFDNQVLRAIEILGWKEFGGEIQRQKSFQLGRQGTLRPDFIICNQEKKTLIPIEVKRPSEELGGSGAIDQLWSYMRQLKSEFGFLIGKEIRIYYDGSSNPQNDPLLLEKIPFDRSLPAGRAFVENFKKESFLKENYRQYLREKITKFSFEREKKKLIDILISNTTKEKIQQFLEREYNDFGAEIFSAAIKEITIKIERKKSIPIGPEEKEEEVKPYLWGKPLSPKIVPTNCNIHTALKRLFAGDELRKWETIHLKDLGAMNWKKEIIQDIIDNPGGSECQNVLESYKHNFEKSQDHDDIPKCIRNTFIVGHFAKVSEKGQGRTEFILWALDNGFGAKRNSAGAIFQVGSTAGRTFGLLDKNNYPNELFSRYF